MSHWIGLLLIWVGGVLCGTVYAAAWLGWRVQRSGCYTRADVDAAFERGRHYDLNPASVDTLPKGQDAKQGLAGTESGAVASASPTTDAQDTSHKRMGE